MEPFDVFSVLERELLPPKKRKPQPVAPEPSVSVQPIGANLIIKEEPKDSHDDVVFVSASPAVKEELIEPKIEISDDETSSESEEEIEEESISTLLQEWDLEKELGPVFEKYKITIDVLQNMTDEDIKVMLPDQELAVRILLRTNLRKWQNINGYGAFGIENMPSTSTAPSNNNHHWERSGFASMSSSFISNNDDLLSKDLESILKSTPKGKQVLDYRFLNSNEPLSKNWRISLCECIAAYCVQHKHVLKNTQYYHLSNEIVRLFPAEDKSIYFTPRISKEGKTVSDPCGCLVDEYNYSCEKLRQACQPPTRYKERKRSASPKPEFDIFSKEQYEASKLWLETNTEPWDEPNGVVDKWKQTFRFRRTSFMSTVRKEPIVEQWPILGHNLGHTLIESDFDQIYADKSQALFEKWEQFCTDIIPIFKTDIKDAFSDRLFQNFGMIANKEMKDCLCFQLINSVLPPTEVIHLKMITPEGKKKTTFWKPSVRDARTSFFNMAYSEENAKSTAEIMAKRYATLGLTKQPLIFGIGYKDELVTQFIVIYHNFSYTVNSFLKAMDIVFKLYHVFNLEYNRESHLMWLFMQRYFYNIVTPYDSKFKSVSKFVGRLRKGEYLK